MRGFGDKTRRRYRAGFAALALSASAACGTAHPPAAAITGAAETLPVWPGPPPGSGGWSGKEVGLDADLPGAGKVHVITNVTVPTLAYFRADPGKASGAAAIVVPGGAFRALAWDLEGTEVARWLARRGIAAFVLKYRVRPPAEGSPSGAETFAAFFDRTQPARQIALADLQQSLRVIRSQAKRLGLDPARTGMIGFSAGAMTVMDAALAPDAAARPDFAVIAYGAMPEGRAPPAGAPPLFVIAAQDDPQVPPARSVAIYQGWSSARLPVELHLFERGGHGFGMRPHHLPVDAWPQALEAWLQSRGLAASAPRP